MKNNRSSSELLCIIQARLGSSRLPSKVLLPLADLPAVVFAALRVKCNGINLIAAVPQDSDNQILRECLAKYNIPFFQGSEKKLFDRFSIGLKNFEKEKIIVRISADNFIADCNLIKKISAELVERNLNYLSASGVGSGLPKWGTGIEVFRKYAFDEAEKNIKNESERLSVTQLMKKIYGNNVSSQFGNLDFANNRITIDTYEDFIYANKILASFDDPVNVGWKDILDRTNLISR